MSNIINFNDAILEQYKEQMIAMVEDYFEFIEVTSLYDAREAFEYEMFVDNNLADKYNLSAEEFHKLHDIHVYVLDYLETVFMATFIPEDIMVEFVAEFDHDDDMYYEFILDTEYDDNAYLNDNDDGDGY